MLQIYYNGILQMEIVNPACTFVAIMRDVKRFSVVTVIVVGGKMANVMRPTN